MRVALISSDRIIAVDGVPCRMWTGVTEAGVPCVAFVHRIVPERGLEAEFERELKNVPPPTASLQEVLEEHLP